DGILSFIRNQFPRSQQVALIACMMLPACSIYYIGVSDLPTFSQCIVLFFLSMNDIQATQILYQEDGKYIEVPPGTTPRRAEDAGKIDKAVSKRRLASERLTSYQELVSKCQSSRFTVEALRLAEELAKFTKSSTTNG